MRMFLGLLMLTLSIFPGECVSEDSAAPSVDVTEGNTKTPDKEVPESVTTETTVGKGKTVESTEASQLTQGAALSTVLETSENQSSAGQGTGNGGSPATQDESRDPVSQPGPVKAPSNPSGARVADSEPELKPEEKVTVPASEITEGQGHGGMEAQLSETKGTIYKEMSTRQDSQTGKAAEHFKTSVVLPQNPDSQSETIMPAAVTTNADSTFQSTNSDSVTGSSFSNHNTKSSKADHGDTDHKGAGLMRHPPSPNSTKEVDSPTTTEMIEGIASPLDPKEPSTISTTPLSTVSKALPLVHSVDKTDGSLCSSSLFALAALATLAVAAAAPAH